MANFLPLKMILTIARKTRTMMKQPEIPHQLRSVLLVSVSLTFLREERVIRFESGSDINTYETSLPIALPR